MSVSGDVFLIKFLGVCDEEEKTPATHLPDLPPGQRSSEKTTCLEACCCRQAKRTIFRSRANSDDFLLEKLKFISEKVFILIIWSRELAS